MDLAWALFACLLGMCLVVGATFFIEETPSEEAADGTRTYLGHGFDSPEYATLQMGGPGAERHGKIIWLGWAFGILQLCFFLLSLAVGARKNGKVGPFGLPLLIGGAGYILVFSAMFLAYRSTMGDASPTLFLSFPTATAWMIYGVWIVPSVFVVMYMLLFDRWTFTEEDAARLKEIVARRRAEAEDAS